jgi:molecular chaperone GrpE
MMAKKDTKKHQEEKPDEKDKKIADLTESLQRLQAEFQNYKKYIEKKNAEFIKYAKEELIMKILPILDSFEFALKNTSDKERFEKGVEMIYSQLFQALENEGVKMIDAMNQEFNPELHEVLLTEESEKPEGTILEELQKGYKLNDRVIRHTKVKIAKCRSKEKQSSKKC